MTANGIFMDLREKVLRANHERRRKQLAAAQAVFATGVVIAMLFSIYFCVHLITAPPTVQCYLYIFIIVFSNIHGHLGKEA